MNYFLIIFISLLCVAVSSMLLVLAIKIIKRQRKLAHSILLVKLKSDKWPYIVANAAVAATIVLIVMGLVGVFSRDYNFFYALLGTNIWQSRLILGFMLLMQFTLQFLFILLLISKSGIVDKGVCTVHRFLDWYFVYDFVIDETKSVVLISSNRSGFDTTKNTSWLLRFNKADTVKLKFILSRNKNHFG